MKRLICALLCTIISFSLCSCNDEKHTVDTISELDSVNSISLYTFSAEGYDNVLSYEMSFNSGELNMSALVTMPKDYKEKSYPTLIYLPEISLSHERMADSFAKNGIISFALFPRGTQTSAGERDLGGDDYSDVTTLYEVCSEFDFVNTDRIFVAGSSEGSINALQLAAKYNKASFAGVGVVNCLSDLVAIYDQKPQYFDYYIGASLYDDPDAYGERSAINFPEAFDCPVLVISNTANHEFSVDNDNTFCKELKKYGIKTTHETVNEQNSDFCGKSLSLLVKWIKSI